MPWKIGFPLNSKNIVLENHLGINIAMLPPKRLENKGVNLCDIFKKFAKLQESTCVGVSFW